DEIDDGDFFLVALSSIARAYARQGAYQQAMEYVNRAVHCALEANRAEWAAACNELKGWLLYRTNKYTEAIQILHDAKPTLLRASDHVAVANIDSSLSRIATRVGRYHEALRHCNAALEVYGQCDPRHRNVARTLVNMAHIKRLIARRVAQHIS